MISQDLLEILACPACETRPKVSLEGQDRLVCTACGRRYPIRDDIPVMLVEEAELPSSGPASATAAPGGPRPNP